jgi:hypothetical protein
MIALIAGVGIEEIEGIEYAVLRLQGWGTTIIKEGVRDCKDRVWNRDEIFKLWEEHDNCVDHWLVWGLKGWWIFAGDTQTKWEHGRRRVRSRS